MKVNFEQALSTAVEESMERADQFFLEIEEKTKDGPGVTRVAWGEGEQIGHDMCKAWAKELGLEISGDSTGNLYMTFPGEDREAPPFMVGSHMDTVPCGGNYDGAAGVISGLAAIQAFKAAGITPAQDTIVMAIRAEEAGSWFSGLHGGHLGSRAALGRFMEDELNTAHHNYFDKSLYEVIKTAGFDPDAIANNPPHLDPRRIKGYCELHIEQGPILIAENKPVGVVSGIRGNRRFRNCKALGEYNHGGATPQSFRKDAALATAEFLYRFEQVGLQTLADAGDLVFNSGIIHTDPDVNGLSKVCGEVNFTLDMRSESSETLDTMRKTAEDLAAEISQQRGVYVDLGEFSVSVPAALDDDEKDRMQEGCAAMGLEALSLPSGGGHDAAEFHHEGVPSSMIFIRNENGSHNPDEAMEMEDFCEGTKILAWMMATA